jgi:AcrR family transcriptional regulator
MSARDALVDATKQLMSEQGYEATSPADIQKAAGVGQGSFYHHFSGKADLAHTALTELATEMCAGFDRLASGDAGPVAGYLRADRNALAGCRIGRICMEASLADERIREPVGTYFSHLRTELTAAFRGTDIPVDPAALADLAIAAVQGAYVTARATGDPSTMHNTTSALLALLEASAGSNSNPEDRP